MAVCQSSSPQKISFTAESADESLPTKIGLLMPSVHTLAVTLTISDKHFHTLEEVYIDGVSITHGSPRQHIWSFVASSLVTSADCHGCKCYSQDTVTVTEVPFIGRKFFCDSGTETSDSGTVFHPTNPLWDGQGCSQNNGCCTFNNPPWFCSELDQHTSDDIELRLCADEPTHNEDIPIEIIELYVQ